jgi:hypothetical protein
MSHSAIYNRNLVEASRPSLFQVTPYLTDKSWLRLFPSALEAQIQLIQNVTEGQDREPNASAAAGSIGVGI